MRAATCINTHTSLFPRTGSVLFVDNVLVCVVSHYHVAVGFTALHLTPLSHRFPPSSLLLVSVFYSHRGLLDSQLLASFQSRKAKGLPLLPYPRTTSSPPRSHRELKYLSQQDTDGGP